MNKSVSKILVADDDAAVRSSMKFLLEKKGYKVNTAATPFEIMKLVKNNEPAVVILDMNYSRTTNGEEGIELLQKIKLWQSSIHVILLTAWASLPLAVEGIKKGAFDFLAKPWDNQQLLNVIDSALASKQYIDVSLNRKELNNQFDLKGLVGDHPLFLEKLADAMKIAATNAPVLLTGESGTGKELFAEAIHKNSHRNNKPFIKVNLGGISQSLFESEMFGHVKGAFTDANTDRKGRVEMADGGTLFLDEIGEMDLSSQVKLLRFLQEQTYERLGDSITRKANVRIVCATNKDLPELITKGTFRDDLYYRINLIEIGLPALRERPSDIPLLANAFLDRLCMEYDTEKSSLTEDAITFLKRQLLPGNVRELKNLVERTALMVKDKLLAASHFEENSSETVLSNQDAVSKVIPLDLAEKQLIEKAMAKYNSNVSRVAKALDISRGALYRRLEKYNIPYNE